MLVQQTVVDAVGSGEISLPKTHTHNCLVASSISLWHSSRYKTLIFSVYVALTNMPEGELLTGFAMRSDPNVLFG